MKMPKITNSAMDLDYLSSRVCPSKYLYAVHASLVCPGKSRKHATVSSSFSITAISKSENGSRRKEERGKEDGRDEESLISKSRLATSAGNGQPDASQDHYPDMVEITEMDYSPARRKPPIHN